MYTKNRLFAKYGHKCEITYAAHELPMFLTSKNFFVRLRRKFIRMRMVSEINKRANYYLRSQGSIAQEHYRHLQYLYMIHPFSDLRIIWEVFMVITYLQQFVTVPLDLVTYKLQKIQSFTPTFAWKWYRNVLDLSCVVDILSNFFTGYYDYQNKEVVLEPKRVALHYLKTYFIFDLISSIPNHLDVFFPFEAKIFQHINWALLYLSFFRLARFVTFRRLCIHFAETLDMAFVTYRVLLTIICFILYYHVVCCILLFILASIFIVEEDGIYMVLADNTRMVVSKGYVNTLYQTTTIICTAGYGNMMINNTLKVVVMFIWVISKILYIYLLARVMEVVMARTSSSHKYVEMVRQLKEYMRHKQLPEYMQKRLLNYYEFRFQKSYFRENEILNTISGQLRQEIIMHSCRKLVENVAFFKNLPITLLVRIVSCLKSEVFLVNDVIVKANTSGDCMYFISTGTVAVYTKSGREICHLEDGSHFGEIALVMKDQLRVASVIAVEICELYRLDRKDFVRAIHPYPDLLNNIQHIAADRMERTAILDEHNRREMASKRLY